LRRLQTRAQFQAVLAGTTVAKSEHFSLHRSSLPVRMVIGSENKSAEPNTSRPLFSSSFDLWIGAMVPKRWAKRAVTRNAIKRQIYNVSADFSPRQRPAAFVVRLRRDFSRKTFISATSDSLKRAIRTELLALMRAGEQQA
jgi:ribonuclease P protein component